MPNNKLDEIMSKYKTSTSKETITESEQIAKATQRPGQTKEQTKLIAQGIQKGIEQFKKQHKTKSRELNKKLKTVKSTIENANKSDNVAENDNQIGNSRKLSFLPWSLLVISWCLFAIYYYFSK